MSSRLRHIGGDAPGLQEHQITQRETLNQRLAREGIAFHAAIPLRSLLAPLVDFGACALQNSKLNGLSFAKFQLQW